MNSPNPELQLADDFVRHTDRHVFLTGKAGTGKTTFLHQVKKQTGKRLIVTAPTGVAAINAGGVTLHSFFQMPLGPFVPGSEAYGHNMQRRFNKEKINIIKSLDLLVIDEISIVRADLLDGVDLVLRRYRRSELPFGGVQLLMIGDLHQLAPVVKEEDWQILREFYESAYFFSSKALSRTELLTIELKHIYRQSDPRFIELLNRVRDNRLDADSLRELNSRCQPGFVPADEEGYITLGTHNRGVDAINQARLQALPAKKHSFTAEVAGDFPEYAFPTAAALDLKVGAQVMFVRNDASPARLYFNGKIGKITRIAGSEVLVKCPGDSREIPVEPATWENIRYSLDPETREITGNKIGSFVQYPLKPAWAITIHKSQGLTFDRAIIDAAAAFAPGQVYVGLSRCRTFAGLVLRSPIPAHAVKSDPAVMDFVNRAVANPPSPALLQAEMISHQQRLLLECFDCGRLRFRLHRLLRLLQDNSQVLTVAGVADLRGLADRGEQEIFTVSENFKRQLRGLFGPDRLPQHDPVILERLGKASAYFQGKIGEILAANLHGLRVDTDNQEIAKRVKEAVSELGRETAVKSAAVKSCAEGFSPDAYRRAISAAELDVQPGREKKAAAVEYSEADVAHPELFQSLKNWRHQEAARAGMPAYRILHQNVLVQIAVNLPDNPAELKKIKGIGPHTMEKYGGELAELVAAYRREHGIAEVKLPEPRAGEQQTATKKEKHPPGHSRQVSLAMLRDGLTIDRIAEERGLARSTITGHLTGFVASGELSIDRLLPAEKAQMITRKLTEMKNTPLAEVKAALGEECSYNEIILVQAHLKYLEGKTRGHL